MPSSASLIGRVFVESLETYGAPRIHAELREAHGDPRRPQACRPA